MPCGLTSDPSSYQRLMNHILQPHKNTFILVYLHGISFLVTHSKIIYNTSTLLVPYLHPMTYAYDFKNVLLRATNSNTSVIGFAKMDKDLPTIRSRMSPNGNALKRFKKLNAFSVSVTSIDAIFTASHICPPPI
jgi:hypothetical protein